MIPYTISRILPSLAYNENKTVSICCYLVSANINKLISNAINYIIEYMYEFCSNGYGIDITSYYDFCEKYIKYVIDKKLAKIIKNS